MTMDLGELFTNGSDMKVNGGLPMAIYGVSKTGKTTFALSACTINDKDSPVIVIDTEGGIRKGLNILPIEKRKLFSVVEVKVYKERNVVEKDTKRGRRGTDTKTSKLPNNNPVDMEASLEKFSLSLNTVVDKIALLPPHEGTGTAGTIVVDSMSNIYEWGNRVFEMPGNHPVDKHGGILRFGYKIVTQQFLDSVQTILQCKWNVILTFQSRPKYVGATETEMMSPYWNKKTNYYIDAEVELTHDGMDYIATVVGDRYGNLGSVIKNPTLDKLLSEMEDKSGVILR